jgi:hypothetical protein
MNRNMLANSARVDSEAAQQATSVRLQTQRPKLRRRRAKTFAGAYRLRCYIFQTFVTVGRRSATACPWALVAHPTHPPPVPRCGRKACLSCNAPEPLVNGTATNTRPVCPMIFARRKTFCREETTVRKRADFERDKENTTATLQNDAGSQPAGCSD